MTTGADIGWLVEGLNDEQRQAVTSDHPRILTIAGAGAGKTSVLTRRIVRLLSQGVPSQYILALTFTRKAAGEMLERVEDLVDRSGLYVRELPQIRTLHSWGAALLRAHAYSIGRTPDFSIYDEVDELDVLRICAREVGIPVPDKKRLEDLRSLSPVMIRFRRRLQEANALTFDDIEKWSLKLLGEDPKVRERWTGSYRHILIDEYQDTNVAQAAILGHLAPDNLFIVGDPRQSIYRFRGAEVGTIISHARDASYEIIQLTRNYRSVPEVVTTGNALVEGDWEPMQAVREPTSPVHRVVLAQTVRDERVRVAHAVQAWLKHGYGYEQIAVLGRTWRQLREIRDFLVMQKMPTIYYGGESDPWSSEDGRAVARLCLLGSNPLDSGLAALVAEYGTIGRRRVENLQATRARATSARTSLLEELCKLSREWAATAHAWNGLRAKGSLPVAYAEAALHHLGVTEAYETAGLTTRLQTLRTCLNAARFLGEEFGSWWTDRGVADRGVEPCPTCNGAGTLEGDATVSCTDCKGTGQKLGVHLMTVHAAKGLEFPCCAVIGVADGVYPTARKSSSEEERAEDLRVLYVAVTRARDSLLISSPEKRFDHRAGQDVQAKPSPFLTLLEPRCRPTTNSNPSTSETPS